MFENTVKNHTENICTASNKLHNTFSSHRIHLVVEVVIVKFERMGRKGKRSEAQKRRWRKLDLSEVETPGHPSFTQDELSETQMQVDEVPCAARMEMEGSETSISCVQASHSQGDVRYGCNRSKQCTCNSLTFLAALHDRTVLNSTDLDYILQKGNLMYSSVQERLSSGDRIAPAHLAFDELPDNVEIHGQTYHVVKCLSRYGHLRQIGPDGADFLKLSERLLCLSSDVNHALLTIGSLTIAVFRDETGRYGFFDPHSRTPDGFPAENGTAVMLTFANLSDMIGRLLVFWALVESAADEWVYELMPLLFTSENHRQQPNSLDENVQPLQSGEYLAASLNLPSKRSKDYRRRIFVKVQNKLSSREKNTVSKQQKYYERNKAKRLEYERNRYANCIQYKSYKKTYITERYTQEPNFKLRQKLYVNSHYSHDLNYRTKQKAYIKRRYSHDMNFRLRQQAYMQHRYSHDMNFRLRQQAYMQQCYSHDMNYRLRKQANMQQRYSQDMNFRLRKKTYIQQRYLQDVNFRSRQKSSMRCHYACNTMYRQTKRENYTNRYRNDPYFRHYRSLQKKKCARVNINFQRILHKMRCALQIQRKYHHYNLKHLSGQQPEREIEQESTPTENTLLQEAIASFQMEIKNGPTYVCTVCHRALFHNQVKKCNHDSYKRNLDMVGRCLTGKYVHTCRDDCNTLESCCAPEEKREWICHSCHDNLKMGEIPSIAVMNMLELSPIPPELSDLNILERHIIARYIPFAKIISLPKGQQKLIHGGVVCVPSEVESTVNALPRPSSQSQLLKVKLKRRMNYTGHYQFQTVDMNKVLSALSKLKEIHSEYKDITIRDDVPAFEDPMNSLANESHINDDIRADIADATNLMETDTWDECDMTDRGGHSGTNSACNQSNNENPELKDAQDSPDTEQDTNQQNGGCSIDSCLQPSDIAQEMITFGEGIFSVAPAQGNKPVSFFRVPKLEAMAFPVQFPTGMNTLDVTQRLRKLTPSRYFNARLFSADNRFALDSNYIFFAQFITEMYLANSSMSIQLRKGKPMTRDGRKITAKMLQDKREVEKLVRNKDATRFMQPLRGTPAYWEKTLRDLFAMLRQLGTPTFFCTFSAAEMRWPEVIQTIKAQRGEQVDVSELDWAAKCEILRSNPVTTMRMFDKRVDALLRHLLLSPAQPIGEVIDYFFRVEYQARGSPHIHLLAWCQNAPVFEEDPDEKVCEFVDKYITCQLPDPNTDPELFKIVTEVQTHSKRHSKSCKKGNKHCRFGFPKQPVENTFITRQMPEEIRDGSEDESNHGRSFMTPEEAKNKLKPVWELLNKPTTSFESIPELLTQCSLSYEEYLNCITSLTTSSVLVMKRQPKDCWINGYNKHLLRAWNANIDIQYILNPYSCIMYILSYISKAEHEMSDYLKRVVTDTSRSTTSDCDEMKQIMQAYSKNREVSVQEAVARVCSLKLKSCSRSVIFIPTDDNALKMSLPLRYMNNRIPESENVWMSGMADKYKNRPDTPEFAAMCMAEFASTYRVVYGRQKESSRALPLQNEMGFIQKRTHGKPAIIRYARFSEKKSPEKFYGTLLKLYLPYHSDSQLKPTGFTTYESFYASGSVRLPGRDFNERVFSIVKENRSQFEKNNEAIEKAIENLEENGPMEDAWTTLAPETEVLRLECISEREEINPEELNEQDEIPEYSHTRRESAAPMFEAPQIDPTVMRKMYQNLNQTQASIFYTVRKWCIRRVCGQSADQFFYFVTGGAGTGKSHLIKCIYTEASKILRRLPRITEERDMSMPTVLLTAFTGTAAFNISGKTLHSVLKLPRSLKPPYQCIGNRLDEVRATLSNAEIIIIDEVSMVSKPLFTYVNWRLQEIKGSKKPFGGMSVLAVGDFYQLPPPGKAKPLCVFEDHVLDFWQDQFQVITLTEIMRQKDDVAFAELLNRIRVKRKGEALSKPDRALLAQAMYQVEDCPKDLLHVFATNKEVDKHNANTISALHSELVNVDAHDYRKDLQTGRMERQIAPFEGRKGDLPDRLQVAEGARVMLIRNIDVEDGLVNGSFGKICEIVYHVQGSKTVVKLLGVELDNPNAGQRHRNQVPGGPDNLVYIERVEEPLSKKGVVRHQFPMKLAFGCTAHKCQGMTTASAVVSLNRIFEPGMAYVGLSRTTSLQGLHIIDFDEDKIYSDPEITTSLENMQKAEFENAMPLLHCLSNSSSSLTLIHHNTEGLSAHVDDVKKHHEMCFADILCFTETHLFGTFVPENLQLENYHMFKRNRHVSYSSHSHLSNRNGGGVAVFVKSHVQAHHMQYIQGVTDLEFLVLKVVAPVQVLMAVIYRPPDYNTNLFLPNLCHLLDSLHVIADSAIVVCGDFNEDLLGYGRKPIFELFQSRGYTHLINTSTTDKNTLLDNIFISDLQHCANSGVLQTYYSYHNPVFCILT